MLYNGGTQLKLKRNDQSVIILGGRGIEVVIAEVLLVFTTLCNEHSSKQCTSHFNMFGVHLDM